jgi:hypothetical protein
MKSIAPDSEQYVPVWARGRIVCVDLRWLQDGSPTQPDIPEEPDDDDDEEGGYPGINRPEMPWTDRESVERPEKAPNPLDEPAG